MTRQPACIPSEDSETARRPSGPTRAGLYYGWVLAIALGITELVSWGILYYAISVFFVPMERELGWSRGESSAAFSIGLLVSGVAAIPIGRVLDERGARLVMSLGSTAGVLLLLAWANVRDLPAFYLIWALIGIVLAATLYEPAFAVVMTWFQRRRVRALTVVTVFGGFASTVFYPLTAWLVEAQGWRGALVSLAAILAVLTIPAHVLLLRRQPNGRDSHPDAFAPSHPRAARPAAARTSARLLLRQPTFLWLVVAMGLNQFATAGAAVHLIPCLADRGFAPGLAATLGGLVGVMQVTGRLIYAPFGDRLPVLRSTAAIMLLEPLGLLAFVFVPGLPGVLLFIGLFGMGRGIVSVTRPAVVAHLCGSARFASISGFLAMVVALSRGAGPVSVGAARDGFGSYDPALLALVVMAIAAAGALAWAREPKDSSPTASGRPQAQLPAITDADRGSTAGRNFTSS